MGKYRELSSKELVWASNVKAKFQHRKIEWGLSQLELGSRVGISQSAVGQYLNGKIPLGLEAKIAFAIALKINVSEIDPEIPFQPPMSKDEQALINCYNRANEKGRQTILAVAEVSGAYQLDGAHTQENQPSADQTKNEKQQQ